MPERSNDMLVTSSEHGPNDHLNITISLARNEPVPNLQPLAVVPNRGQHLPDFQEPTLEALGVQMRTDDDHDLPTPNLLILFSK